MTDDDGCLGHRLICSIHDSRLAITCSLSTARKPQGRRRRPRASPYFARQVNRLREARDLLIADSLAFLRLLGEVASACAALAAQRRDRQVIVLQAHVRGGFGRRRADAARLALDAMRNEMLEFATLMAAVRAENERCRRMRLDRLAIRMQSRMRGIYGRQWAYARRFQVLEQRVLLLVERGADPRWGRLSATPAQRLKTPGSLCHPQ